MTYDRMKVLIEELAYAKYFYQAGGFKSKSSCPHLVRRQDADDQRVTLATFADKGDALEFLKVVRARFVAQELSATAALDAAAGKE